MAGRDLVVQTSGVVLDGALAQANLTVDGRPIRAQAVAAFFREAASLLRDRITRLAHPAQPRPDPYRPSSQPMVSVPPARCTIVRRKRTVHDIPRLTPAHAASRLDTTEMPYRFAAAEGIPTTS
ncbi:hypothetical protein [Amycolatopsis alkalitolerans]|uniref:Uncharacterized protein n=1 Tax=Amycolatopsis alkalitolerans TaxID=2547244 RepID=A0A5C4M9I2_9PSEU|nr:hypothetical protein [Amycolatopsis alkalitolerans]TNC28034.1 hypothetical protein FG385_06265 [Amycolatopsis alkalitolerans]